MNHLSLWSGFASLWMMLCLATPVFAEANEALIAGDRIEQLRTQLDEAEKAKSSARRSWHFAV